ncbi:hypothetical protein [Amycolatopsis sacchari]|uniref:Uncharacterized protein n=1 Tax=Amycolatopsis sacchari TaxID=115433 RepID=A0A1I3UK91_9PSEU|nr:hypothetical protein [Amycolatopsis sacchari]SFJ83924.1 hypothetical protein SAMN05421835_109130 [Amycolatopsis sacchari]
MSELARSPETAEAAGAVVPETGPGTPQLEADQPWPSALAHAVGSGESWREALSQALDFTDQRPLGAPGPEGFILAEQADLLRGGGTS